MITYLCDFVNAKKQNYKAKFEPQPTKVFSYQLKTFQILFI